MAEHYRPTCKNRYKYFDTPDGQDIHKKLYYVMKPTILGAIYISTADVLLNSRPKGYPTIIKRFAYISLPIIGMSTAFVLTTNGLCLLRGADDKLNWVAGGMAAGVVFGIWKKTVPAGFVACSIFSLMAVVKKFAVENNYTLFPIGPRAHGGLNSVRADYSLLPDCKN